MSDTGGAKELVEARHIAAVIAPEKGRAPVLNKDIAALTDRMKRDGGKSVFQAEVADKDDDTIVNFDQMRRVLDDDRRRIAAEKDDTKRDQLQKRYDRLSMRINMYDKLLNNEGYGSLTPQEKNDMVNVMVNLPGFCESVSLASGGQLTVEQVNKFILGKGGVLVTPDQRKAINSIVEQFAMSDKLHARLAKNLAALTLPPEDVAKAQEIETLRDGIKDKDEAGIRTSLTKLKEKVSVHELKAPDEKDRIKAKYDSIQRGLSTIAESYRPQGFDDAAIDAQITAITSKMNSIVGSLGLAPGSALPVFTPGPRMTRDPFAAQRGPMQDLINSKDTLTNLKTVVRGDETNLKDYSESLSAATRVKALETDLKQIEKDKAKIAATEGERGVYADKYRRKLETALSDETKRFWNDVVIAQATQAAGAEAAIKAEKTTGEQNEVQKREQTANGILEKYLKLAYLKYKNGKVVGWDDGAIKNFMHKDLLSQSPRKLTRSQLEKVYYQSGQMPAEYRKELKRLLGEMGVGQGTPPLTFRQALDKLSDGWYDNAAAKTVPEMLGYAWGRGYYFDRMKLKGGEAEFLRQAYPPEFFDKAYEARQAEFDMAQKMLDEHLLGGGAVTKEALKKVFGTDWTQGMKRVMKTAAVAGAVGAGLYGGVSFLGGGSFIMGKETLAGVAEAAKHTVLAASKATAAGVRTAAGAVADATYGVEEAIKTAAGGNPLPPIVRHP